MNQLFEKQGWHALSLAILLVGTTMLTKIEGILTGKLFGLSTTFWFWLAVSIPIAHQILVMVVWRKQLEDQWMTRLFGERDFTVYTIMFNKLFLSRPVSAILLSIANRESFNLPIGWRVGISLALFIPFACLMYSVLKYFGFKRALGIDHFDESYRELPLVRKGIFKYTSNGMYTFGFFIMWIPPILAASKAGLLLAAFSHLYIWVHYFTTEKPDMERIYGKTTP
jgi:hypothetical protein